MKAKRTRADGLKTREAILAAAFASLSFRRQASSGAGTRGDACT